MAIAEKEKLPDYFKQIKEARRNTYMYPFEYDSKTGRFSIGEKIVSIQYFDPKEFTEYFKEYRFSTGGIEIDKAPEQALLLPVSADLIAGPKLHDWAQNNPEELSQTAKVMHDAYGAFYEEFDRPDLINDSSAVGFFAATDPRGGVNLQVFGSRSGIAPNPNSYIIREQVEYGFAEYKLQNAGYHAQRASLYAGMGHIARLANRAN